MRKKPRSAHMKQESGFFFSRSLSITTKGESRRDDNAVMKKIENVNNMSL